MAPRKFKKGWCCRQPRCAALSPITDQEPDFEFTASLQRNLINLTIEDQSEKCLIDSGAAFSCISKHVLRKIKPNAKIQRSSLFSAVGVCGEVHPILGETVLQLTFGKFKIQQKFRVFETIHARIILGIDFLQEHQVKTDFGKMTITIQECESHNNSESFVNLHSVSVETSTEITSQLAIAETLSETIIPPHSEIVLALPGAKAISNVNKGLVTYRLLNPTNQEIVLPQKTKIVKAVPVHSDNIQKFLEINSAEIYNLPESEQISTKSKFDLNLDLDKCELSERQKFQLKNFLEQNRDIFAKDLSELGQTDMHYHPIYTDNSKPVSAAPYRQTPKMREELEKQLDEMEKYGIIEESQSPWHSPVVLVKKPNNSFRLCVDFRSLNRITEPVSFPILHMTDVFDTLADSQAEIFSTLDLKSGFWQVPLDPATKHKSAFITHKGVYEFNRLPFGMMNSPMTFQCLMTKVLKDLNFKIALVYIDDILIFSKTFEEHLHHLKLVFTNLRAAKLKLNPEKCKFGTKTVKYLGHIISKDGIRVNPENVDKVKNFPRPASVKQVKSFLGMANFYRKFVKDYAKIASPLTSLLKKTRDRGNTFVSNIVKALSELFNITRHLTSSYHPQTNGSVERMNSVILQAFRAYTKDMQDNWIDYLPGIMMAYRATPATQSTDYSPFFLLYGREMSLPIDTSLVPKDHLTQDNKIFLARILQNMETTRTIAAKNIELARQKYKQNYDKRTKDPGFRPTQRVWLYCTKVPVGKAPKLHRKWVGPYYITRFGPHHTYKLRNCATNKEVKSLVNAQRLKPYHDPEERPTNIPNDMENNMDEHDPDELDDQPDLPIPQPNNNNQQIQEDQTDRNNEQVDQPENQDNNNVPDTEPALVRGNNAPVKDTRPSCKDCDRGNCKPFSENEIDSIVSSARGNGTLYYKIKFIEKTRKTDWYFTCKIPCRLVREFHAKRTMGGKKRKRPLQKHKFFDKPDENVNHIAQTKLTKDSATQTESETDINSMNNCNKEKLISVRIFQQKAYFLVQQHNKQAWQPITIAKDHAATFIETRKEAFRIHKHELHMQYMKHKFKHGDKKPFIDGPTTEGIFEAYINKDGKDEFLISYKNSNIPPEWSTMEDTPNGLMNTFLNKLEGQYNDEISIPW
ncbi:Transposon Ty3-G Gag-Pol polyprotein,Transposon Ty3-I Gag-Pol polyprotein,Retrovirus-related Pol polyprotein from transposon 297,Retrovirus-related Pol polyprotein from transposon opus [Mytilus coruscus]|uniref:Transposon Ty3-G Gag-Pol polyprotein,Transposon Ty3-I Gag-Pol polyprotein,Retrovirus-related Pol polyprotein from transposon 297,Retrovirus-related Pol polyprotein from transposon opus n=1 Tax=Mytilus coruscus TaxID=42192 RepID=A0A6J8CED1_MYTCO|nr:Transposon Ty3-G Gag-Pol polyprotein,Transposon Ty3-I Gag-Pol polyprotein,Retrovirus-related Pol polyprotein from transposon 297,Retrovirus-related Pol polyprotein from transposon opus [Mytilus coruscus]